MKKQIPILFSTPMVQAVLEDRKTMTRRLKGLDKIYWNSNHSFNGMEDEYAIFHNGDCTSQPFKVYCPYGQSGDIIWVRESFYAYGYWVLNGEGKWRFHDCTKQYQENYLFMNCPPVKIQEGRNGGIGWYKRPSIHMPKDAARIWLEVTKVIPERLHSITEQDAIAEGVEIIHKSEVAVYRRYDLKEKLGTTNPVYSFKTLWIFINGPESWEANPWVWVVSFKVLSKTGKPILP